MGLWRPALPNWWRLHHPHGRSSVANGQCVHIINYNTRRISIRRNEIWCTTLLTSSGITMHICLSLVLMIMHQLSHTYSHLKAVSLFTFLCGIILCAYNLHIYAPVIEVGKSAWLDTYNLWRYIFDPNRVSCMCNHMQSQITKSHQHGMISRKFSPNFQGEI